VTGADQAITVEDQRLVVVAGRDPQEGSAAVGDAGPVTGWVVSRSDPNRGDHLPMAPTDMEQPVERQRAPNNGVSPLPREVSGSPSRCTATVPEPTSRRTVVPAWTRTARLSRKGTSRGASPLRSGTLLVDLERQDTASRPSMSWPASCRPTRRWVAADGRTTVPARRWSTVWRPGGGHAADQAPGWPARCGATAEGLLTPRYPTTSSMSLCSRPS
jgi:hypothetical protein